MDQKLSRQEKIWEIKKLLEEENQEVESLNENMKDTIKYLVGAFGKGGTKDLKLGAEQSKFRSLAQKLGSSEQITNLFAKQSNPKTVAGLLQTLLLTLSLNNPDFDQKKVVDSLRQKIKSSAAATEEFADKFRQGQMEKEGEKPLSDRGRMTTKSTTKLPTPGEAAPPKLGEGFGGKQNKLAEMVARKVANKLIVKMK